MEIDWSREFDRQLDRLEADTSERGKRVYRLLALMLRRIRELDGEPVEDTAMIKRVRQSRVHTVWWVSHPFREGIAAADLLVSARGGTGRRGTVRRR